jgi:ASC-1-like (ASCH) protein
MDTPHVMEVTDRWASDIEHGAKVVEGRKKSNIWGKLRIGQMLTIKYKDSGRTFTVEIEDINYYLPRSDPDYDPLDAYLEAEGVDRVLPGIKSFEEARNIYLQFSTLEEIKSMGFMGIKLKVLYGQCSLVSRDRGIIVRDSEISRIKDNRFRNVHFLRYNGYTFITGDLTDLHILCAYCYLTKSRIRDCIFPVEL